MQDLVEIFLPDSNQISLATELGIVLEEGASADSVVLDIDQALAEKSIEEQARWFVLSVFRHLTSAQWFDPSVSNLDLSHQHFLAQECLAIDGFKKSMTTVLKDRRYRFTLLSFGKSKDIKKNIMSSATKAFKIAAAVLKEDGLLQAPEWESNEEPAKDLRQKPDAKILDNTAANRRAGRRGYLAAELHNIADTHSSEKIAARKNQVSSMSEKEFLDLEAAIENTTQKPVEQEWNYRSNEDRWSLILGLAAGVGFFSLVLILFL